MPEPNNRNCPFYGRNLVWFGEVEHPIPVPPQVVLWATNSNQCAVVLGRFSLCYMEVDGLPVDWRECQRMKEVAPDSTPV